MNDRETQQSAILNALRWLRAHWLAFLICSGAILIPCFWHQQVQAADLGSHLYNAWLSQSVERDLLPGLSLEPLHTNILIDLLLGKLLPSVGVVATQRIVASLCVLVFFWGAFALASAAAREAAWSVVPLLAMFAYGVIFHWGFLNFYLSVGFSLFALAIVVCGNLREFLLLPVLLVLSALAHPMGAACLVALAIYLIGLRWLSLRSQLFLTSALLALAFVLRWYVVRHVEVLPREISQFWLLGADQLYVFGRGYLWISGATLTLCAMCIALAWRRERHSKWLQFYLVIALVVCFAPGGLHSEDTFGMMGFLPDRGSLYSAVALTVLVANCRPRLWFPVATAALAVPFFAALHHDTGILQQRVQIVSALVRQQPEGRRMISLVQPVPGWRIHEDHSVDRACIGYCYSYTNYEPSTSQFRLRAEPDNRFVLVDNDAIDRIKEGQYVIQPRDLPVSQIYACGDHVNDLCVAELHAGQKNGDLPHLTAP
ncbi:hypothetical protein Acid345_2754 [Candidatus Koribacter versatilis Ellin345]|uniref:Glycosyltransferase RgtA/B/C/D-like domain-containing protein n=1 Tax=Koribacter versatilis (strain Ellin345) TaxID=204669 RepID=Q1IMZ5_KORVE|nr:hypothetical protein [Candidatus Koribacter versatilis]ABF41755.1 hypothetical protein Acid345_2754 [Candidatus Koribacter versatilis Ellin345]